MTANAVETRRPLLNPADVVDVFVYVVVLNLAAEYMPLVITETFTLSLLTALLLKVVLELVVLLKDRIKKLVKASDSVVGKALAGLLLWGLLIGSKFGYRTTARVTDRSLQERLDAAAAEGYNAAVEKLVARANCSLTCCTSATSNSGCSPNWL